MENRPRTSGQILMSHDSIRPLERWGFLILMALLLFMLPGCGTMKRMPPPPMVTIPGASGHFWIGQILDVKAGKVIPFDELIEHLCSKDLIFLGEVHDNPEHHLIQMQILQALTDRCGPSALAMEVFQSPQQNDLDRYLWGEMPEETFLEAVDWKKSWSYDYLLYRPLILWAKANRIPVLAINAPIAVVRKVARQGLKNLDDAERSAVAEKIDLSHPAHRDYLRRVYEQHRHGELESFEHFYEAQCVWEETMAENASRFFKKGQTRLVVIAGNGHLINKYGIPDRTLRRVPLSAATLLPYPVHGKEELEREVADYIWLTSAAPHRFRPFHEMKRRPRAPEKGPEKMTAL